MNESEWLMQLRGLAGPTAPRRDLWPSIAARLETRATLAPAQHTRWLPWAMAATLAVCSLVAGGLSLHQATPVATPLARHPLPARITPWQPHDIHLLGAAIELNIARAQLLHAIRQRPDAPFLRRMLENTNAQVQRLQLRSRQAG